MSSSVDFKELQYQFAGYIRDPENNQAPADIEPRRLTIYKELFFNNIEGFLSNGFPVIRSLFSEQEWLKIVREFMRSHRCHSPLFAEISLEFLDYLSAKGRYLLNEFPFLLELAHYEWVEVSVIYADEENIVDSAEADWLTSSPVRSSVMHLLAYEHPVHQISNHSKEVNKSEQGVFLVVYRNNQDQVAFMELNAVSYRLLDLVDGKLTGKEIIDALAKEMAYSDFSTLYLQGIELMAGFKERNILLGVVGK